MSATKAPVLALHGLTRHFDLSASWLSRMIDRQPRQILRAVDGVTLSIPKGSTFSLVGESGCGKSTVARLVVGLYRPTSGVVLFEGRNFHALSAHELKSARRRIQMIFQDPYASLNPRWRVANIIAEPLRAFAIVEGKAARRKRVDELLCHVGLAAADGDKFPHEFSGGQRQRISIARALASEPEFLVCDEPTSALDVSVQAQILNLMRDLQQEFALTYLFISHNLAVVNYMSDQVGVMYLGRLAEVAPARTLFAKPRHPYTRVLLDTIPDLDMTGRKRAPVAGEVPNPISPPSGCSFHPRCPYANRRCTGDRPELHALADGALVACHAIEERRLAEAME